jgi:hypothetical protein
MLGSQTRAGRNGRLPKECTGSDARQTKLDGVRHEVLARAATAHLP